MFNPFKVQLSYDSPVSSDEREKFLEYVNCQLQLIGCNNVRLEGAKVRFSNKLFSFTRSRYHIMAGIDSGSISFSPFSNQVIYEYRSITLGVIMIVFAVMGLLVASAGSHFASFFPYLFLVFLAMILGINWGVTRNRQNWFLKHLVPNYVKMKSVFSRPQ